MLTVFGDENEKPEINTEPFLIWKWNRHALCIVLNVVNLCI